MRGRTCHLRVMYWENKINIACAQALCLGIGWKNCEGKERGRVYRKKLIRTSSILPRGKSPTSFPGLIKSCVAYQTPFLHAKLITFQCIPVTDNDRADRRYAITRQESVIAGSKVCLQALSLPLPSLLAFFHPSAKRNMTFNLQSCLSQAFR